MPSVCRDMEPSFTSLPLLSQASGFRRFRISREKRLLATSCPSVLIYQRDSH
jgi:hypothetical protein